MQLYTTEQLSKRIRRTPEGYILCEGSVLARTGLQIYGAEELIQADGSYPVQPVDGVVRVERNPEEVFRPETIASANIKSLVDDHHDVLPENWQELTVGIVFNVRRGEGLEADLLLADILVTVPSAMDAIDAGKVELSCGYDAKYRQISPGRGAQFNIIINHVALVEKGRCGPRCAIRDAAPTGVPMSNTKKANALARLWKAFATKDEAGFKEAAEELEGPFQGNEGEMEGKGGDTHVHVHVPATAATVEKTGDDVPPVLDPDNSGTPPAAEDPMATAGDRFQALESQHEEILDRLADVEAELDAGNDDEAREMCRDMRSRHRDERMGGLTRDKAKDEEFKKKMEDRRRSCDEDGDAEEAAIEAEAPTGTADRARKAHDSAFFVDAWKETVSAAEILAPGIALPTFDHAARPAKTVDTICKLRSSALVKAYADADTKPLIDEILGGRAFDAKMPCAQARTVFFAATAMKRKANNASQVNDVAKEAAPLVGRVGMTPSQINVLSRQQRTRA